MTWAGYWRLTVDGDGRRSRVSLGLVGEAQTRQAAGLTFLQISDSHVGLRQARQSQRARHARGSHQQGQGPCRRQAHQFMIHTGDNHTHLSRKSPSSMTPERIISQARLDVHYVPGEPRHPRRWGEASMANAMDAAPIRAAGPGTRLRRRRGAISSASYNVVDLKAGRPRQSRQ